LVRHCHLRPLVQCGNAAVVGSAAQYRTLTRPIPATPCQTGLVTSRYTHVLTPPLSPDLVAAPLQQRHVRNAEHINMQPNAQPLTMFEELRSFSDRN